MKIFCQACNDEVDCEFVGGEIVYPKVKKFHHLKFWRCLKCKNHVSTHRDGKPLGTIASPEIKQLRKKIHDELDPIWKNGHMSRSFVYGKMSVKLGYKYHTAEVNSVEDYENVMKIIKEIKSVNLGRMIGLAKRILKEKMLDKSRRLKKKGY